MEFRNILAAQVTDSERGLQRFDQFGESSLYSGRRNRVEVRRRELHLGRDLAHHGTVDLDLIAHVQGDVLELADALGDDLELLVDLFVLPFQLL